MYVRIIKMHVGIIYVLELSSRNGAYYPSSCYIIRLRPPDYSIVYVTEIFIHTNRMLFIHTNRMLFYHYLLNLTVFLLNPGIKEILEISSIGVIV